MSLSTTEWDGPGDPTILLAHATGFNKLVWRQVAEELRRIGLENRIVAFDFRSHGASPKAGRHDWSEFGDDVVGLLKRIDGPVLGVGHSMGGAAMLLAALEAPERFIGLVLVEPIVFPATMVPAGQDHPLTEIAGKRRRTFSSPDEALQNFAEKPVFARWRAGVLSDYVEGGLVRDGGEWALACEPTDEAATFAHSTSAGLYERLDDLAVPVVLVIGADTDTYPPGFVDCLQRLLGNCTVAEIAGSGHFVPMEKPDVLAGHVAAAAQMWTHP